MGCLGLLLCTCLEHLRSKLQHDRLSHVSCHTFNKDLNDSSLSQHQVIISMALCKTAVAPVLTHWSYCSLALSHGCKKVHTVVCYNPFNYIPCMYMKDWAYCTFIPHTPLSIICHWPVEIMWYVSTPQTTDWILFNFGGYMNSGNIWVNWLFKVKGKVIV